MPLVPWYRRNYIIDPRVQLKIVCFLASIALIAAAIICYVAYAKLLQLGVLFNYGSVAPAAMPAAFQSIANSLMYRLIAIVCVMVLTFSLAGVILTHRIAGPIWKLQSELRKFLAGEEVKPIRFRSSDEFQELPRLINALLEKYRK